LLAADKPVMVAPAMNVRMWDHAATRANIDTLKARGINVIGPEEGEMACGEFGFGRMSEPADIVRTVETFLNGSGRLSGRSALVTSGPTFEAIDPVRYVANRSSGKQGHAIASALSRLGADTVLVSGPTHLPDPPGVHVVHVESAADMMAACETALPRDIAVCAAAVSDWRAASPATIKLKKNGQDPEPLALTLNADILASLGNAGNRRPGLLIGFAAETDNVIAHAEAKLAAKGCDWIVANDVSAGTGTFGGDDNTVHLITPDGVDDWPAMSKVAVADKLAGRIADTLEDRP
ncbi:MAG: bifunctional phosphopantothenoylcysteine decarboxylase/phosphopantothenate--cysteine ligase CoaBC, partial [Rhodospirillaceae bacterium]|nr:bifunctional phosphopantothenoylcysteine decarboxylase/phosphopantothenate--cysteine ligase CoaBC [Rhodospirillaceae bacterium]